MVVALPSFQRENPPQRGEEEDNLYKKGFSRFLVVVPASFTQERQGREVQTAREEDNHRKKKKETEAP